MMLPSCTMATQKTGKLLTYSWRFLVCLTTIISTVRPAVALEYSADNHTFKLGARARIAHVDAQSKARAASFLFRLHATSEWSTEFSSLLELDYVALGFEDEFTNGVHFNGKPVIPDVAGADLNQALLQYSPTNTLQLTIGREAINLGNQRFVGTNSFWQNEQTFDTAGVNFEFGQASHFLYRYVDNTNRITGEDAGKYLSPSDTNFAANNGLRPAPFLGDHDHNTHLIFAHFKEWDYSQIQAYYFDMDIKDAAKLSNRTLGLLYEYKGRWNKLRTLAHAELALQERTGIDNDTTLQFYDIGAGIGYRSNEFSINYQHLGESKGASFVTPLASLHNQNGWADKFLITPNSGLRDYSFQYIWRKNPVKFDARFHIFRSDISNSEMGKELNLDMSSKLSVSNSLLLRYAFFFSSDDKVSDEQRLFLMYTHNL